MSEFLTLLQTPIPLAEGIDSLVDYLSSAWSGFFGALTAFGNVWMNGLTAFLLMVPAAIMIIVLIIVTYFITGRKFALPIFTFIGLLYVYNQGLWDALMYTTSLVITASFFSVVIGVPLGILSGKNKTAEQIIKPILDFMQTMPAFVYLIPAVAFFGIGQVPGVIASIIFALPPTVRMTSLGLKQIPKELEESAISFGSTAPQRLFKVELPLARGTIMAGVNQTTMLALSMVVTASMIGAPGLGENVLTALQKADNGSGFVSGLALVVLAIIMDRCTQSGSKMKRRNEEEKEKFHRRNWILAAVLTVLIVASILISRTASNDTDTDTGSETAGTASDLGTITISYVQWDSETASTNVVAKVLEEMGYDVNIVALDNAVNWEAVATGQSDATVSAWLPNTHAEFYAKYGDQMDDLGANLEGAKIGLVVPTYMEVDSIADLTDEAGKQITAIEPGAGVTTAAQKCLTVYPNLSDWTVVTSSTGAMLMALDTAYNSGEEIIVTGWTPHWIFERYDLKYLEDPLGVMEGEEHIETFARLGLKEDMPEAYEMLDNFYWTTEDMESVMLDIADGMDPADAAAKWIEANRDTVDSWIPN